MVSPIASQFWLLAPERQIVALPPGIEGAMSYYRLYVRNHAADGHMVDVHEIFAGDDVAAMQIAGTYPEEFLELWQEGRRVTAFEVDRKPVLTA